MEKLRNTKLVNLDDDDDEVAQRELLEFPFELACKLCTTQPVPLDVMINTLRTNWSIWVHREGMAPLWFDIRYKKLPFICFACGRIGHNA